MEDDVKPPVDQPAGSGDKQPEPTPASKTETPSDKTSDGKPILDPSNLPPDATAEDKAYALQMQRYLTRRTQALAEAERSIAERERQMSDQQTRQTTPPAPQPTADPTEMYLQREFEDAVASGDTARMLQINKSLVDIQISKREAAYAQRFAQSEMGQKRLHDAMLLEEFGRLHPDFWDFHAAGIAVPILREFEKQGKTLDDAYTEMKRIATHFGMKQSQENQARIQEKKNAVSATPTPSQETEIVYVESPREARIMNITLAAQGSNKVARVKPRAAKGA